MTKKEQWEVVIMAAVATFIIVGGHFALARYHDYVAAYERVAAKTVTSGSSVEVRALALRSSRPGVITVSGDTEAVKDRSRVVTRTVSNSVGDHDSPFAEAAREAARSVSARSSGSGKAALSGPSSQPVRAGAQKQSRSVLSLPRKFEP